MKLKDNRVTKIDPNYKEIRKLDALLTEAGIPHTFQTLYWNKTGDLRGAQINIPGGRPEPGGRRNNKRRQLRKRI